MNEAPGPQIAAAGYALIRAGHNSLAWQAAELALAVDAGLPDAHTLRAHLLEQRGDFAAALAHWREAARLAPDDPKHRSNLALSLLALDQLAEGFTLGEARLQQADWSSLAARGSFLGLRHRVPRPADDMSSKRVLVFSEQGLGDCIWAARWLPALRARCRTLELACQPALRPLLRGLVEGEPIVPPDDQKAVKLNMAALAGRYDAFVPMMSLPSVLGVSTASQPAPWLAAQSERVAAWRARYAAALPAARRIVGVVWRANPQSASAAERSLPPSVLAGLGALPGVGIVNLQGGAAAGRGALDAAVRGVLDPLAAGEPELDGYLAMLAATDLLITADTMAAHLAGAVGHPVWVAVPSVANFYWGRAGEASPWYAGQRLFRQMTGGDWSSVGAAMVAALAG